MDSRNLYSDAPEKEEAGPPPGAAAPDFSLPAGRESLTDHGSRILQRELSERTYTTDYRILLLLFSLSGTISVVPLPAKDHAVATSCQTNNGGKKYGPRATSSEPNSPISD